MAQLLLSILRLALIGFGSVGKAFASLLAQKQLIYPFRIVGVHTARHGTAYHNKGLSGEPEFGPPAESIGEFLDRAKPDVAFEITTLSPQDGEPAISHIRSAFARGIHVVTANKGPIAIAYAQLAAEARSAQVEFRYESTVMDGTPIFNKVRNTMPAVEIHGFTGVLNSTSKVVLAAMAQGRSMADGIREAQEMGIAESDASFDVDGWDSAAKAAALANVLMDANVTPNDVKRQGIGTMTTEQVAAAAREGRTVVLTSRGERVNGAVRLRVAPEIVDSRDLLAAAKGTSNLLLLHTDLLGTMGTISIDPGVEQTAYGLFVDLVDIARSV